MTPVDIINGTTAGFTAAGVLVAWAIYKAADVTARRERALELYRRFNTPEFYMYVRTGSFATLKNAYEESTPTQDWRPGTTIPQPFHWWVLANTDFHDPASREPLAKGITNLVGWADDRRKNRLYMKDVDGLALDSGRRSSVLLAFFTELEILITKGQIDLGLAFELFKTPWAWFERDIHGVGLRILERRREQLNAPDKGKSTLYRRMPWQISAPRLNAFFMHYKLATSVLARARLAYSVTLLLVIALPLSWWRTGFPGFTNFFYLSVGAVALAVSLLAVFVVRGVWSTRSLDLLKVDAVLPAPSRLRVCVVTLAFALRAIFHPRGVARLTAYWLGLKRLNRHYACDQWFLAPHIPSYETLSEPELFATPDHSWPFGRPPATP